MKLPSYETFPCITDEQLILHQVETPDLKDLLEISFYDGPQATNTDDARIMQEKIDQNYRERGSIHWRITDKTRNQLVGTIGYYRGFQDGTGEPGCILLPQYRGLGYMSRAMKLAINLGFNTMKLKRINAFTTNENLPAIKLLDRLHFIKVTEMEHDEFEYVLVAADEFVKHIV